MLKYLLEKEFKQILRNKFLPKLIIMFPLLMMLLIPYTANMEVKKLKVCVVDNDHSSYSSRLVNKIENTPNVSIVASVGNYDLAMNYIKENDADIIITIPNDFEKDILNKTPSKLFLSANAVNAVKGGLGTSYLLNIIQSFIKEVMADIGVISSNSIIEVSTMSMFNPKLDYKLLMVPALMVMLLTILTGFLPALNIVSEKEIGTIEQINVTPVKRSVFILAKLIPYWIIGFIVLTNAVILAWLIYGITPVGSLLTFYTLSILYVFVVSGMGLLISNYSKTMQQAMFLMYFFLILLILMSGLFTPIDSMPKWAQLITQVNPMKYFVEIMRMVYMKGTSVFYLKDRIFILILFALILNTWAILSYKKST